MLRLNIERTDAIVPPPAWVLNSRAEVWHDIQGGISAYAEVLGEEHWIHLPGLASFRFSRGAGEIAATVTSGAREELVLDAYRRKVLPMALQVSGREVLHASAVRSSAGVAALCGLSETGKSTIAFGLSRRGYPLWADDAVVFEVSGHGAQAVSLPFNMRLRQAAATLFDVPETRGPTGSSNDALPFALETAPLVAVCVLQRADRSAAPPVTVCRLSLVEAFAALLDHSCCFTPQDEERKRRMIHNYLDLAAGIPIFNVCFQSGLTNLPAVLEAIERVIGESGQTN
ncbi:MAG TPA: hypothetical protein VEM96_12270 [Pyrinomonadaceae bacterium]|nr:hypothetical protein [Pyrinomonadaceae bacterium]